MNKCATIALTQGLTQSHLVKTPLKNMTGYYVLVINSSVYIFEWSQLNLSQLGKLTALFGVCIVLISAAQLKSTKDFVSLSTPKNGFPSHLIPKTVMDLFS